MTKPSSEAVRLELLRSVLAADRSSNSAVFLGVEGMDDAALLRLKPDELTVVTSDFVRGSGFHLFELGHLNYYDVGYYLIVANVSDLAAMGARPVAATTIIRYSDEMTDEGFLDAVRGMRAAADDCKIEIVGGDIGGHSADVFAATAIGQVKADRLLRRTGAKVGDALCVTGTVGRPITALTYFKKAKPAGFALPAADEERLLNAWRRPTARVQEGQVLGELGCVSACQDVSDGLKASIEQIGEASGVSFRVDARALNIDPATLEVARSLRTDAVALAMSASVDFELLFTVRKDDAKRTVGALNRQGCSAAIIGESIDRGSNRLVDAAGHEHELPGMAWQQQQGDYLADIIRRGAST